MDSQDDSQAENIGQRDAQLTNTEGDGSAGIEPVEVTLGPASNTVSPRGVTDVASGEFPRSATPSIGDLSDSNDGESPAEPPEPSRPLMAEGLIPGGKGRAIFLPRPKGWPPLSKTPEPYLPPPPALPAWAVEQDDSQRDPRVFPPAVKRPEDPVSESAAGNIRLKPAPDGGPPMARPIVLVTLSTDQMHAILEAALKAAGQRDAKTCSQMAEQQVSVAFFKFRAEQRVLWRR